MLFRTKDLDGIRNGTITLAFRRWRRPTVRAGGTLLTPIGQLRIEAVERVESEGISSADARRAGYHSLQDLRADLGRRPGGEVYRIELGLLSPDPRVALRAKVPDESELTELVKRLERLDGRADGGPWTRRTLELLYDRPSVRAGVLCRQMGQDKMQFKQNVRKLKALGLTASLEVGYRLSARGAALLTHLRASHKADRRPPS